jgi:KaiC/GvpD/RAD55 family RecA-like ATPase
MVRNELVNRSPLRILERSMHGGLGKGNIGVIAAQKGVGKTACLVHIATDQLLEGKQVIHVSFSSSTDHIIAWYEDIFQEIAKRYHLDGAMEVHDDIIKHRVIMNFKQEGLSDGKVQNGIRTMINEGRFTTDVVVIDGFDFEKADDGALKNIRRFAQQSGIEVWFSASVRESYAKAEQGALPPVIRKFLRDISVVIELESCGKYIHLKLVKDHDTMPASDLHLKLDPQILLIAEETEPPVSEEK